MNTEPPTIDAQRLGQLALAFRATRAEAARRAIADEYARAVESLVRRGGWDEMPNLEDQLPDDWMPEAFFAYWAPRRTVPE